MIFPPSTELRARRSGCHAKIPSGSLELSIYSIILANWSRPGFFALFASVNTFMISMRSLLVILLGALASIENAFSFGLSCFHTLGGFVGFHGFRRRRKGFWRKSKRDLCFRKIAPYSLFRTSYYWGPGEGMNLHGVAP